MPNYFLREDFEKLQAAIDEAEQRARNHGREMGISCDEGAETFHDNFAYEDSERRYKMWARRLKKLVEVRNAAQVIDPTDDTDRIAIGRTFTLLDFENDERRTFRVGSYISFDEKKTTISYRSPLAKSLIGAFEGEIRSGRINGEERCFKIVKVA